MPKVAVTTTSFCEHDPRPLHLLKSEGYDVILNPYGRKLKSDEVISVANDAVGIIAGLEEYGGDTFNRLTHLKVISRVGVGLDNIDLEAASQAKIKIFNTPDAVTVAVAEFTVGLVLNLLRNICPLNEQMKSRVWGKESGTLLNKKNVGLIGFGRIGRKVASFLSGFDCRLYYYDPNVDAPSSGNVKRCADLDELLKLSDVVSLHCQALPNREPLLTRKEFETMKKGSWFINTARGSLIEEDALFDALKSGHLRGAALDVFSDEPYQGRLCELDNVILTPHIGSYARESRREMELEAVQNLLKGLEGRCDFFPTL